MNNLTQRLKSKCTVCSPPLVSKCGPHQHYLGNLLQMQILGPHPDLLNSSKGFWFTVNLWNLYSTVIPIPRPPTRPPIPPSRPGPHRHITITEKTWENPAVWIPSPGTLIWLVWVICFSGVDVFLSRDYENTRPRTRCSSQIWWSGLLWPSKATQCNCILVVGDTCPSQIKMLRVVISSLSPRKLPLTRTRRMELPRPH